MYIINNYCYYFTRFFAATPFKSFVYHLYVVPLLDHENLVDKFTRAKLKKYSDFTKKNQNQ